MASSAKAMSPTPTMNTQTDRLYSFLKDNSAKVFAGAHNIHTPQALVEEILKKVPLQGEILVLFNVEFVISLVYNYKVDPSMISFYSDHANKTALVKKMGVNKIIDSLDNNNMKFDVVIGNPPYQDDENVGDKKTAIIPLWFRLTKKAFAIAKEQTGIVAFVTPSSWMSKSNKIHKEITSHVLLHARLFEKTPFPGVGTTVSVWVAQNINAGSRSAVIDIGDKQAQVNFDDFIPATCTDYATKQSILNKTLNSSSTKFNFIIDSRNHSSKTDKVSAVKTQTHIWPVLHTYSTTTWTNVRDDLHNVPKLLVSKTGSVNKAVVSTEMSIGQNTLACVTTTEHEAHALKKVLLSKLYKFITRCPVHSATTSPEVFKSLPAVDLTRSWTDAELYAHFNLTQDEIDLIEATVK